MAIDFLLSCRLNDIDQLEEVSWILRQVLGVHHIKRWKSEVDTVVLEKHIFVFPRSFLRIDATLDMLLVKLTDISIEHQLIAA